MYSRPVSFSRSFPLFSSSLRFSSSFANSRLLILPSYRSFSSVPPSPPSSSSHSSLVKPDYRRDPRGFVRYLWEVTKIECKHLWHGTKLLYHETKLVWPVYKKSWSGAAVSRRERLQMIRSSADLLRLIPFSAIVIIPAAELALPFILYFFPNFLPSTFVKPEEALEKHQKELQRKAEVAKFLRSTARAMTQLAAFRKSPASANLLHEFHRFIRDLHESSGRSVSVQDIIRFSPLFTESLTLSNLSLPQLEAMAQLVLVPVGTFDNAQSLRKKLKKQLRDIRLDDELIRLEGLDSLTELELREACRARGIASNQSVQYMKKKIGEWLELSLDHQVPESLLVFSRALSQKWVEDDLKVELGMAVKLIPEEMLNKVQNQGEKSATQEGIEKKIEDREAKVAEKLEQKAQQMTKENENGKIKQL